MKSVLFILFALLAMKCWSFTNIQTTASLGHFQDINKENHTSVFFNVRYHYTASNGVSSSVDVGLNNNLYRDNWSAHPYMATLTIPLDNGFINAPYHKSRIILGRQMLTEGFDLEMIDGVIFPYYFSPTTSITGFIGALHATEEESIEVDDQIYGLSMRASAFKTKFQLTPTVKSKEGSEAYFTTLSLRKTWNWFPFLPAIFIKEQWDIKNRDHLQSLYEAQLVYKDAYFSLGHTERIPDQKLLTNRSAIYRLLAWSEQESLFSFFRYRTSDYTDISLRLARTSYHVSQTLKETGNQQQISYSYHKGRWPWTVSGTHIDTYGGRVIGPSFSLSYIFSPFSQMIFETAALNVEKINNMEFWAYSAKLASEFKLRSRWRFLVAVEGERNHHYDIDAKVVGYVTHFYY